MVSPRQRVIWTAAAGGLVAGVAGYFGLVTGAVPIDLGIGRRIRPLRPLEVRISASRETVFNAIAATWWPPPGKPPSRPHSTQSRPRPNGNRDPLLGHLDHGLAPAACRALR